MSGTHLGVEPRNSEEGLRDAKANKLENLSRIHFEAQVPYPKSVAVRIEIAILAGTQSKPFVSGSEAASPRIS